MEITVDRAVSPEGHLVFTITAKDPVEVNFDGLEKGYLDAIDNAVLACEDEQLNEVIRNEAKNLLNNLKYKNFIIVSNRLKFTIRNSLDTKFQPICQEIYNWIYDNQTGALKQWMQDYDPQRTKYYFDNDKHPECDYEDDFREIAACLDKTHQEDSSKEISTCLDKIHQDGN